MAFADNLKDLPKVSHLEAIQLLDAEGTEVARIENKPGQAGSLAVYNHLAQLYGAITPDAARKGWICTRSIRPMRCRIRASIRTSIGWSDCRSGVKPCE